MAEPQPSIAEAQLQEPKKELSKVESIPPPLPPRALPRLHTLGMAPSGTTIDSRGHLQSYSGGVNNMIAPIRPRPVLASASAFSFDSGLEVSPLTIKSFKFGESPPNAPDHTIASCNVSNFGVTFSNVKLASVSSAPCRRISFGNEEVDDGVLGEEERETDTANNSIEGYDKELEAIHQRFFTPIPTCSIASTTTSTVSIGSTVNVANTGLANLAVQRRSNRVLREQEIEINNNDVDHANAYVGGINNYLSDSFYDVFDMDVGDDEVFLREDEQQAQQEQQIEVLAFRPEGPLVLPEVEVDDEEVNQELFAQMPARGNGGAGDDGRAHQEAAQQPPCVCCPPDPNIRVDFTDPNNRYALPIRPERCPNYRFRNFIASSTFVEDENNFGDVTNMANYSAQLGRRSSTPIDIPRSSNSSSVAVDEDAVDSYSVPRPITHMPYYHPMAPSFLRNPPQQPVAVPEANANNVIVNNNAQPSSVRIIQPQHHRTDSNSSARSTSSSARRTPFGSHLRYETSDITTLNIVNSGCYSPPPVQQFNWFRYAGGRSATDSHNHRLFMRFTSTTLGRSMQSMVPIDGSAGRLGRPYPIMRPLAGTTATFFFAEDYSDEDDIFNNGFETLSEDEEGEAAEEAEMLLMQQGHQDDETSNAVSNASVAARRPAILRHTTSMHISNNVGSRRASDEIGDGYRYRRVNRRAIKHRNTLTSIELPTRASAAAAGTSGGNKYSHGGRAAGGAYSPYQTYPIASERRTMSVSFPIDESSMRQLGSDLRQLSNSFQSEIPRLNSSVLNSLLDLVITGIAAGAAVSNAASVATTAVASAAAGAVVGATRSTNISPALNDVNNSILHTHSALGGESLKNRTHKTTKPSNVAENLKTKKSKKNMPKPTTTGNSTFYVGTSSSDSSDEGATGSDQE